MAVWKTPFKQVGIYQCQGNTNTWPCGGDCWFLELQIIISSFHTPPLFIYWFFKTGQLSPLEYIKLLLSYTYHSKKSFLWQKHCCIVFPKPFWRCQTPPSNHLGQDLNQCISITIERENLFQSIIGFPKWEKLSDWTRNCKRKRTVSTVRGWLPVKPRRSLVIDSYNQRRSPR